MQSLAGSGEIWGKGAIYLTDLPAACAGACQGPVLPCPNLYVLLAGPLPCACSRTSSLALRECWRPVTAQEAATIIPRTSWHLKCVMPCDVPIILEVAVQLNAKSQACRNSFQLFVDSMQRRPGGLPMSNRPTKHDKAIQYGKKDCQDIWKLAALSSAVDAHLSGRPTHRQEFKT